MRLTFVFLSRRLRIALPLKFLGHTGRSFRQTQNRALELRRHLHQFCQDARGVSLEQHKCYRTVERDNLYDRLSIRKATKTVVSLEAHLINKVMTLEPLGINRRDEQN